MKLMVDEDHSTLTHKLAFMFKRSSPIGRERGSTKVTWSVLLLMLIFIVLYGKHMYICTVFLIITQLEIKIDILRMCFLWSL